MDEVLELFTDYIDEEGFVQRFDYEKHQYYNTGINLRGKQGNPGRPGRDGITPHIDRESGHWFIGSVDTGVSAVGSGGSGSSQGGTMGPLKTINGQSIEGEGNIAIKSYHTFNNSWNTSSTTQAFCTSIVNDASAVAGMTYLGKLGCSDLPAGLIQGEAIVEIIAEDSNGKNIHIILNSADTEPYRWEYHYCKINGSYTTRGWQGYQLQITSTNKLDYSLIKNGPTNGQDGQDGIDGKSAYEIAQDNGYEGSEQQWLASLQGSDGSDGQDGVTPHIDPTSKHWIIGTTDTGVVAEGQNGTNGTNGTNGVTPHIDSTTKHWMIGSTDTGIVAEGQNGSNGTNGTNGTNGSDGITPTVNVTAVTGGHNVAFSYGSGDPRNTNFNVLDGTTPTGCVTSSTTGLKLEVVAALPANPDANTVYIVQ